MKCLAHIALLLPYRFVEQLGAQQEVHRSVHASKKREDVTKQQGVHGSRVTNHKLWCILTSWLTSLA